jgi:plastocyanin
MSMAGALAAFLLLIASLAASGCGGATRATETSRTSPSASVTEAAAASADGSITADASTTGTAPSQRVKVVMKGSTFTPASVTIRVGDTVTWQNQESVTHNVAADDGSFTSQDFRKGGSFSFTFARPGIYSYSCRLHPNMRGKVIVE